MNAINLSIAAFLLLVVLASVSVMVFYVRHWSSRQTRTERASAVEGVFFKRYVPVSLRAVYDHEREERMRRLARRIRRTKLLLVAIVTTTSIGLGAAMFLFGWDRFAWIDLTPAERAALDYTAHHWQRLSDERPPRLASMLPALRRGGVTFLAGRSDGAAGRAMSQWKDFLSEHRVPTRTCGAAQFASCGPAVVYIVPPGAWDRPALDALLAEGASVLLYGPPAQTTSAGKAFEFHGLRFVPRFAQRFFNLALVGDRALTLGFDAGLSFPLNASFHGYAAHSEHPQAVEKDDEGFVGGELLTRLYARSVGKGRFVWMDFSPNWRDHATDLPVRRLHAVLAAVLRYLLREEYSAWATWPQDKSAAAVFSVDTEDQFRRAGRIVDLAEREHLPITWFVVSNLAQVNRRLVRRLQQVGEVACHGDSHASFLTSRPAEQVVRIARCRKAVRGITGKTPRAFRPPYEEYDDATIDAVLNNGMSYYFAEAGGERAVPAIDRSQTTGRTLVSLPRIGSDDYELWTTRHLDYEETVARLKDEVRWARTLGGLLMFDFHTQYVTDEHMRAIEELVRTLRHGHIYLSSAADVSRWWRLRAQLMRGEPVDNAAICKYRPSMLVLRSDGGLTRIADPAALDSVAMDVRAPDSAVWQAALRSCG